MHSDVWRIDCAVYHRPAPARIPFDRMSSHAPRPHAVLSSCLNLDTLTLMNQSRDIDIATCRPFYFWGLVALSCLAMLVVAEAVHLAAAPAVVEFPPWHGLGMLIVALIAGARHASSFPLNDIKYSQWLLALLWSPEKPLPFRRYRLGWQDGFSVAILILLAWNDPYVSPWYIPVAYLLAYSTIMCKVPTYTCDYVHLGIYCAAVLVGLFIWRSPPVLFALAMIIVIVLHPRIQRSASRLYLGHPNDLPDHGAARQWRRHLSGLSGRGEQFQYFPYNMIREPVSRFRFSISLAILVSCGTSMILYAISIDSRGIDQADEIPPWGFAVFLAAIPALRLFLYGFGRRAPLSLRGRFVHRYWIIPGYDQIFVAPIVVFLVGQLAYLVGMESGLKPPSAFLVALAPSLYLSLRMRPFVDEWICTGDYQYGRMYQFSLGGKRI